MANNIKFTMTSCKMSKTQIPGEIILYRKEVYDCMTRTSGARSLYPWPIFLSKNQLVRESPCLASVVVPALAPNFGQFSPGEQDTLSGQSLALLSLVSSGLVYLTPIIRVL